MSGPREASSSAGNSDGGAHDATDSICVGCGLCCDGTLFGHVDLLPDEPAETLRAVRVALTDVGSDSVLTQPCSCSVEGRCTIYQHRPSTCRGFRCALLRRVEAGETTSHEARAVIEQTRARRDDVLPLLRAAVLDTQTAGFFRLHRELHDQCDMADDPVAARAELSPLLLRTGGVHAQLVRYFYGIDDQGPGAS